MKLEQTPRHAEPDLAVYVYGVIRTPVGDGLPSVPGLDDRYPVHLQVCDELAAVVSNVDLREFEGDRLRANLEDEAWLEETVWSHQRVVQALFAETTVAPLRFGAVYRTSEGVDEFLGTNRSELAMILDRVEGRVEWGVKIYASAAPKPETPATGISGRTYLESRSKALADARAHGMEQAEAAQRAHERLAEIADGSEISSGSREPSAKQVLVLNASFLVRDEGRQTFLDAVRTLEEESSSLGLRFAVSGPWPPYSFAMVTTDGDR